MTMTPAVQQADGDRAPATFDSLDPRDDSVLGTYPVHTAEDVAAAVAGARAVATWWRELGFIGRKRALLRAKAIIARRMSQLADVISAETGKPVADAQLEIILAIEHLDWAARNAPKVLGRQRRAAGMLLANNAASVQYEPLGVVAAIGPWNYPAYTPLGSISYALAAGNTVVFKPSEYTPGVGQWLTDTFTEAVGQPVLQLVTGFGETGAALVGSDVDKIAFTGSAATGRAVMAAAAQRLTPVVMECGGKDALLVDADADIDAAADATVWGSFANAGQTCAGVERVYVHERVYDDFLSKVVAIAKTVRAGDDPDAAYGPMTMPGQRDVVAAHIADALDRGGRAVVGGPDAVGARYVQPTVLVDVPEDARAVREETFGPTVTIARVRDMSEAVAKANDSTYGLGSSVFSTANGAALAERLDSGVTAVNALLSFAGIAALPFGGRGDSGFGCIHGPEGLREFARSKAIARQRFTPPMQLTSFSRPAVTDKFVAVLTRLRHGRAR